jgi:lysophospholipase L1-like esterase
MRALEQFFTGYGEWGREHGIRTWLAFMPTKLRAAYGQLRFAAETDAPFARWMPTDLPDLIARFAASHGIDFVDLTPAIATAKDSTGEFMYNSIYDTHLNEAGSSVVADALAERIGEAVSPGAGSARGAKPPPAPRPAPQSVAGP